MKIASSIKKIGDLEKSMAEKDADLEVWKSEFKEAEDTAAKAEKEHDEVENKLNQQALMHHRKKHS